MLGPHNIPLCCQELDLPAHCAMRHCFQDQCTCCFLPPTPGCLIRPQAYCCMSCLAYGCQQPGSHNSTAATSKDGATTHVAVLILLGNCTFVTSQIGVTAVQCIAVSSLHLTTALLQPATSEPQHMLLCWFCWGLALLWATKKV